MISKLKVLNYLGVLEIYKKNYKEDNNLNSFLKIIEYVKDYYSYLIDNDIFYGEIALDFIELKGKFGKFSDIHFRAQSIFEGINPAEVDKIKEKIIVDLAYNDMLLRSSNVYNINKPHYDEISKYCEEVFIENTTPYAWDGLLFNEVIGSGSWFQFHENGGSFLESISPVLNKIDETETIDFSVKRMVSAMTYSFEVYYNNIKSPFIPLVEATSIEQVISMYDLLDSSRVVPITREELKNKNIDIEKLNSDTKNFFKILPASKFEFQYYLSSTDDEPEESTSNNNEIGDSIACFNSNISSKENKINGISTKNLVSKTTVDDELNIIQQDTSLLSVVDPSIIQDDLITDELEILGNNLDQ